jgi:hypothetical protein
LKAVIAQARRAVDSDIGVLIEGETGTGKEVLAAAIHYEGPRREHLFAVVNCAGIPETLLESELFGYRRGAFSGAATDKKGLFDGPNPRCQWCLGRRSRSTPDGRFGEEPVYQDRWRSRLPLRVGGESAECGEHLAARYSS